MDAIVYYILLPFIYGISILPFWLLYVLSDILFLLIYHIIGYRKKVVIQNLTNSFPEKSEEEIQKLAKQFFHFLCDIILETLKGVTISKKKLFKHHEHEIDPSLHKAYESGQSVVLIMGHYGNWETGGVLMSDVLEHYMDVVYHPLSNPYFDKLIYHIRSRFGMRLFPMKGVMRYVLEHKHETTALTLVGDQTPPPNQAHWIKFLNQDTGVFPGTAKIARKFDWPIFYVSVLRQKRGYYKVKFESLIPNPKELSEEEISFIHMKRLEQDIQENPAYWLWSHKRWKHSLPEGKTLYEGVKTNIKE